MSMRSTPPSRSMSILTSVSSTPSNWWPLPHLRQLQTDHLDTLPSPMQILSAEDVAEILATLSPTAPNVSGNETLDEKNKNASTVSGDETEDDNSSTVSEDKTDDDDNASTVSQDEKEDDEDFDIEDQEQDDISSMSSSASSSSLSTLSTTSSSTYQRGIKRPAPYTCGSIAKKLKF
jgi:hypothetical protein